MTDEHFFQGELSAIYTSGRLYFDSIMTQPIGVAQPNPREYYDTAYGSNTA